MVIPRAKYDEIIHLFEQLESENDKIRRTKIRREIERFTCSVRKNSYFKYLQPIDHFRETKGGKYRLMSHLFILDKEYEFDEEFLKGIGKIGRASCRERVKRSGQERGEVRM